MQTFIPTRVGTMNACKDAGGKRGARLAEYSIKCLQVIGIQ